MTILGRFYSFVNDMKWPSYLRLDWHQVFILKFLLEKLVPGKIFWPLLLQIFSGESIHKRMVVNSKVVKIWLECRVSTAMPGKRYTHILKDKLFMSKNEHVEFYLLHFYNNTRAILYRWSTSSVQNTIFQHHESHVHFFKTTYHKLSFDCSFEYLAII